MSDQDSAPESQRTLAQWIDYIQTLHPRTIDLSLERVAEVWGRIRPQTLPPVIAVAGTNGKGSSVSMLESIYRLAGYSTGSFTSPHLVRFSERICLDSAPVGDHLLLAAFNKIEQIRGEISLTFFEFNTLLALDLFCAADVDVMLLEVGMGGRLDAVNIIENDLALITAIGLDHCAWLGDDLESIAVEKAGIIKYQAQAVIADPQAPRSIVKIALEKRANFVLACRDYQLEHQANGRVVFRSTHTDLQRFSGAMVPDVPAHQQNNMAGVIASVAKMQEHLPITLNQLETGLKQSSLAGRLQLIRQEPMLLLDVSHNEASVLAMINYIDTLEITGRLHAVFGALADKRYEQSFDMLKSRISAWYLATLEGERGQTAMALGKQLFTDQQRQNPQLQLQYFDQAQVALEAALSSAEKNDLIVIFGSFHIVGAIISNLNLNL